VAINPFFSTYDPAKHQFDLRYPNGSMATVAVKTKGPYLRLQLTKLRNRHYVDNIVWGPIHTTISQTIGDFIGAARDGNWAVGMLALNDNTTEGPPVPGDFGQMYYYIHSPDPVKYPVPPKYKEGQRFSIGGDGRSDVAFYSHPEEYFHMGLQHGAVLEPNEGSVLAYHSRDRRKPQSVFFTLIPGLPPTQPRHQTVDGIDADFVGSSVAMYACPDVQGLQTIHQITKREGLLDLQVDGKWAKDPAGFKPDIAWSGPHDKMIAYADALGLKSVQDEGMGEFYMDPTNPWEGPRVDFAKGPKHTIKDFTDETRKHGIRFGLHTLCMFVQTGSGDVHPIPNPGFQTVLRTKLGADVSPEDTQIKVTDPGYLAEKGTWHDNDINVLRIGTELLSYDGIKDGVIQSVKRGQFGTNVSAHHAGEELVKLQITCYHGFIPDMKLLLHYADLYAKRLVDLGMDYVDFDGLESCMYQNHGDFAFKSFFHRLFDTYRKLSGGRYLRVMGSCVCEGNWHYMSVCNVGGGNNMFDPVLNRWGIEGKDVRYQFASNYFPATFGIQDFHSDWSVFDAENLEAKSIGWGATYMLGLNQDTVERSGEKDAIFQALKTWQEARSAVVFDAETKARMKDLSNKFHLTRNAKGGFQLAEVKETATESPADGLPHETPINNRYKSQPLNFTLQATGEFSGAQIRLPDGQLLTVGWNFKPGQFVVGKGGETYVADSSLRKLAPLWLAKPTTLPAGISRISVRSLGNGPKAGLKLRIWVTGPAKTLDGSTQHVSR